MLDRTSAGELPRKHHIQLRGADGALRYEECITREGFDGPYTLAYHLHRPQAQSHSPTRHGWAPPVALPPMPLAKRHLLTLALPSGGGAPLDARVPLAFNGDLVFGVLKPDRDDPVYFVNGDADDLFYVFRGGGTVRSTLGDVRFGEGDYVYVPKGVAHRILVDAGVEQHWVSVECLGGLHLPRQWRNATGQLRMDAPYCHRDFRRPVFEGPRDEGIRETVVKRRGVFHGMRSKHSPLDVVGWDGTSYPWAFAILDFQPRVSTVHLPPTWHGTFATRGALICSFVPRLVDFHPEAIPCPYPHSSVDCDEILFYCSGNFTSRRGVGPGSVSLHPMGIPHGPHPGAYEASIGSCETSELAVMLDTFAPLELTAAAAGIEDAGYHASFLD
ncbi:MAG: homogentisate 1,2-dioxygenase [Polyangiales bacterium]